MSLRLTASGMPSFVSAFVFLWFFCPDFAVLVPRQVKAQAMAELNSCGWKQVGDDLDGIMNGDYFGESVTISGDAMRVAVGGPGIFSTAGYVKVYEVNIMTNTVTQIGPIIRGERVLDESGKSVALNYDGSVLAVGAPSNDNENGRDAGHVRVYRYSNGAEEGDNVSSDWLQVGQDIDGEFENDFSAEAVALNSLGTIVAVGATEDDGDDSELAFNQTDSRGGQVRVFQYSKTSERWLQMGQGLDGEEHQEFFGYSVALNSRGDILAVGAARSGVGDAGRVTIFRFDYQRNAWNILGSPIDGQNTGDWFGSDVALSSEGSIVAAGAYLNDDNGVLSGHVRVFEFSNATRSWVQLGNKVVGEADGDLFGHSVTLSSNGKTLAVGAILNSGKSVSRSGSVRVFMLSEAEQKSNDIWQQVGSDIDGEGSNDQLGYSVALSGAGTTLVVGARNNDGANDTITSSGHARVFALETSCSSIPTSAPTTIDFSIASQDANISVGAAIGFAVAALAIGLVIAGLVYKYKRRPAFIEEYDLPIGELVDIDVQELPSASDTGSPIVADVLATNESGRLPEFKDQVLPTPRRAASRKDDGPEFKDQVQDAGELSSSIERSSKPDSKSGKNLRSSEKKRQRKVGQKCRDPSPSRCEA